MKIIWQEFKYLDKSTNHSSRTEIVKQLKDKGVDIKYYCTYKREKKYFGLSKNEINYVDIPNLPKIRAIVFFIKMYLLNIYWIVKIKPDIIMSDTYLVQSTIIPVFIKRLLRRNTKYILDVRTLPVVLERFEQDMKTFNRLLQISLRYYNGFSFITPFMRDFLLKNNKTEAPTVVWSSGFNEKLFDSTKYESSD
ncbi:MAG: hypothetical protein GF317_13750, partial [Candidatus Lokiarchaeota archaeon]|nr:hypothetical protein [Candidatus Lokiarchaeota archaeon]